MERVSLRMGAALAASLMIAGAVGAGPAIALSAKRGPARFPVIVVFEEDAPFHRYQDLYRPDERAQAYPEVWGYQAPGVAGAVQALEAAHGFCAEHVYSAGIEGFSAKLTAEQIQAVESEPLVAYVEPDGVMRATGQILLWGVDRVDADLSSTQSGDGMGAVTTVNVYIIDTGIDRTHADLTVVNHVNFTGLLGGGNQDCHGHGTHVAGGRSLAAEPGSHAHLAARGRLPQVRLGRDGDGQQGRPGDPPGQRRQVLILNPA